MIQYGGDMPTSETARSVMVSRSGAVTTIWLTRDNHQPSPIFRMNYVTLISLIARLNEAAKDAAKEKR